MGSVCAWSKVKRVFQMYFKVRFEELLDTQQWTTETWVASVCRKWFVRFILVDCLYGQRDRWEDSSIV